MTMKKKQRILLIAPMPPLIGGIAVSAGRLYENLKADGYDVDYYDIKLKHVLRFLWIPVWILFHRRYDIIHCHVAGNFRKWYLAVVKPFYKGARLIYTQHGDITTQLANRHVMWALSKADDLICVQPGDSRRLPSALQERSVDIPAFILPKHLGEEQVPVDVMQFVHDGAEPLILFYGGVVLTPELYDLYGIGDAVAVYLRYCAGGRSARLLLLISHDGSREAVAFMDRIRERIAQEAPEPSLVRVVENRAMPMLPLFRHAQVYIRPSKTDGDSLAVREALSQRCPVVASDRAVRPEGAVVYHNADEFLEQLSQVLIQGQVPAEQPNFYAQIVSLYEQENK